MTTWTDDFIEANGIKLHYTRGGSGPTLVLSHGLTDNGRCWMRVADVLAADYDVVLYDARGHGRSDAPEQGYTTADRAADLAGLIDVLGLQQPVLLGHSMGADTSAAAAAAYPALMRAVILEDPPWRQSAAPNEPTMAGTWRANLLRQQAVRDDALLAEARAEHLGWADAEFEPWIESKRQVRPQVFNWINGRRNRWRDDVARIQCPALLIAADPERGAVVTPEVAQEFLTLCPRGQVVHLSGAGHNIRREQFERYVEVVQAFLRETIGSD